MCIVDDVFSKRPDFVIPYNFPAVLWDTKSDRSIGVFFVDSEGRVVVFIFVIIGDMIFGVWSG